MRVIGGSARGVQLKGPPRRSTRATSDKVRGAIFDILAADVAGASMLDLYSGTGALGIEALSRGADTCLFVEQSHAMCLIIRANLELTRLSDRAWVWCGRVSAVLDSIGSTEVPFGSRFLPPYDIVVLDPPYDDAGITRVVNRIGCS